MEIFTCAGTRISEFCFGAFAEARAGARRCGVGSWAAQPRTGAREFRPDFGQAQKRTMLFALEAPHRLHGSQAPAPC